MSPLTRNAYLVCDSSINDGSGHVMRSITLGLALQKIGFVANLVCSEIPAPLQERSQSFGIGVIRRISRPESEELGAELNRISEINDIVIFDGYKFLQSAISEVYYSKKVVVVIDDNGELGTTPCHLILNQNLHSNETMYSQNSSSPILLLGLSFALIRPEIAAFKNSVLTSPRKGVLISIGGTDHLGIAPLLYGALQEAIDEDILITGGFFGRSNLSPGSMASAMAQSKLGIIACGTTIWEAICLGLPFIGLITADNQLKSAIELRKHGLADIFDTRASFKPLEIVKRVRHSLENYDQPNQLPNSLRELVDGLGSQKVAAEIEKICVD